MGLSVPQQDVNKGNDLQCFAQPHAVSKDAAKATAGIIALQRLNEVIIEKPDSPDLRDEEKKRLSNKTSWTMIFFFNVTKDLCSASIWAVWDGSYTWWGLTALASCGARKMSFSSAGWLILTSTRPWTSGRFRSSLMCAPLLSSVPWAPSGSSSADSLLICRASSSPELSSITSVKSLVK